MMIINQLHSIGDILFLEPMFRFFMKERHEKPIVPVRDHLMWLQHYIDSATFVKLSLHPEFAKDTLDHSDEVINARFANQILRGYDKYDYHDFENVMPDKYRLVGLDPDMWQEINLNFDQDRGDKLIQAVTGSPMITHDWIIVNENSQAGKINIPIDGHDPICYRMSEIDSFNVIDWFMVMADAIENHHVSTCTFYIMQAIKNKFPYWNSKVTIYPRPNSDGLRGISQLNTTFKFDKAS